MRNKLSRYEIIDEIGAGGFATVYAARDPSLDRDVALKVMRPLLMSDPDFVARFQREAQVAANLQHPNIVPIYDFGQFEGRMFLVMKLMGTSLAKLLERGALPWSRTLEIISQVAAGMDFAHARDVIHRDIKPDNILLDEETNISTVADFGIVKALGRSTITLSLTQGVLGTPAYIPPEIWNGEPASSASDIYALACVFFEMVTGEKLFEGPTPPATMTLHFRPPRYPEAWPQGVPPALSQVLDKALARERERRYATAEAFAGALRALALDPLADEYAALQAAHSDKAWDKVVGLAEAILVQDANYMDVPDLLQRALQAQALERQSELIRSWRDEADRALSSEDWDTAIAAAQQWLQVAPDDRAGQAALDLATAAKEEAEAQKSEPTTVTPTPVMPSDETSAPKADHPATTLGPREGQQRVARATPEPEAKTEASPGSQFRAPKAAIDEADSRRPSRAYQAGRMVGRRSPFIFGATLDGAPIIYIVVVAAVVAALWPIRIPSPILAEGSYAARAIFPLAGWVLGPFAGAVASGAGVTLVTFLQGNALREMFLYALAATFSSFAAGILIGKRRKWGRRVAVALVICFLLFVGPSIVQGMISIVQVIIDSWPLWSSVVLFVLPTRALFAKWIGDKNLLKVAVGLFLGTFMMSGIADLVLFTAEPLVFGWYFNPEAWHDVWHGWLPLFPKVVLFRSVVGTGVGLVTVAGMRRFGLPKAAEATY